MTQNSNSNSSVTLIVKPNLPGSQEYSSPSHMCSVRTYVHNQWKSRVHPLFHQQTAVIDIWHRLEKEMKRIQHSTVQQDSH